MRRILWGKEPWTTWIGSGVAVLITVWWIVFVGVEAGCQGMLGWYWLDRAVGIAVSIGYLLMIIGLQWCFIRGPMRWRPHDCRSLWRALLLFAVDVPCAVILLGIAVGVAINRWGFPNDTEMGVLSTVFFLFPRLDLVEPVSLGEDVGHLLIAILWAGAFILAQLLVLYPRADLPRVLAARDRARIAPAAVASIMASLLVVGIAATVLDVLDAWHGLVFADFRRSGITQPRVGWGMLLILAVALLWLPVFVRLSSRDRFTSLRRLVIPLALGAIVCVIASMVVGMVSDPGYWFWTRGSYTGFFSGMTVLVWALAPALVLSQVRAEYCLSCEPPICPHCGYDLTGHSITADLRCPECGKHVAADHGGVAE
jgi:hypothetical protein